MPDPTTASDNAGNSYKNICVAIGNTSEFSNYQSKMQISSNIVIKGAIRIDNVLSDGTNFSQVKLNGRLYPEQSGGSWSKFSFTFKNVPIIR